MSLVNGDKESLLSVLRSIKLALVSIVGDILKSERIKFQRSKVNLMVRNN